jgi:uncharacterized RDD family membrane protein YckC
LKPAKPSIWRYLAIICYDLTLLSAVWFFATLLILPLNHGEAFTAKDYFYPVYLFVVSFCFYSFFWTRGGQTLGLKTWKCKVVSVDGNAVSWRQALIRFNVAVISLSCLGLGFIWKLVDGQGRSWQDIASKTEVFKI